jgi:hypothetical protein
MSRSKSATLFGPLLLFPHKFLAFQKKKKSLAQRRKRRKEEKEERQKRTSFTRSNADWRSNGDKKLTGSGSPRPSARAIRTRAWDARSKSQVQSLCACSFIFGFIFLIFLSFLSFFASFAPLREIFSFFCASRDLWVRASPLIPNSLFVRPIPNPQPLTFTHKSRRRIFIFWSSGESF